MRESTLSTRYIFKNDLEKLVDKLKESLPLKIEVGDIVEYDSYECMVYQIDGDVVKAWNPKGWAEGHVGVFKLLYKLRDSGHYAIPAVPKV